MAKVLGRYHIISELGRGGMGVVYKAVDPKLERFIAIKCLSDELSDDEITVTRFLREARNVAALNHPHIAQIFLADEDEGRPYFVMEFIDGESLAEKLARDKRLMPEQARRIIIESAQALQAAHEENIVHRDIKPGNIMIDRRGRAILTDFGIASIVHPDQQPKTSKYIMGTPGYLPPEVMTGQPADHRGDIFALGAVYYEMLAGKRLVPGRDIEDTARTLLASDFPVLADLDEKIDQSTFGVLGRMLAQDPNKRYQSYDDLLADLEREAVGGIAAPARPAVTGDEPTRVASPPPTPAAAASAELPVTEAVNPSATPPPTTANSAPPSAGTQGGGLGLLFGLAAGLLLLVGAAVASLAFLMPERWDQLTAVVLSPFAGETTEPAAQVEADQAPAWSLAADLPIQEPVSESDRVTERVVELEPAAERGLAARTADETSDLAIEVTPLEPVSAAAARLVESEQSPAEQPRQPVPSARDAVADIGPAGPAEPASVGRHLPDQQPTVVASAPVTRPAESARVREPVPAPPPPSRPRGVLVVGVGDPVFIDPMVREIEQALRQDGHEIVERGFVPGLSGLVGGEEVDLAGLAGAATQAGARFAVLARAMPSGQRELRYYGRTDTAFIVQVETITYDLSARRRIDASDLEQIEYTVLNATRQARESVAPQLARISARLQD